MQIKFERTGGFAGLHMACALNVADLPPEEAKAVQSEIEAANFFDLPPSLTSSTGADRFTYRIEVEEDGKVHTVEAGETALPENLRLLVDHLTMLTRTSRGKSST